MLNTITIKLVMQGVPVKYNYNKIFVYTFVLKS